MEVTFSYSQILSEGSSSSSTRSFPIQVMPGGAAPRSEGVQWHEDLENPDSELFKKTAADYIRKETPILSG